MPQGNFAAYSPQEQIAAARQLLASRGLPINADNLNRAMHALYTNSDFVPPPAARPTARALPLPPEFPEQAAPTEVEREQPPSELPSGEQSASEAEAADKADALEFFFNILPRVAALAPGPIGVVGRAASFADLLRRYAGSRPAAPASPPTNPPQMNPQLNPWINRQVNDLSERFRRLFTVEQPTQPPRSPWVSSRANREAQQNNTSTRRSSRRTRRQNAAESN